MKNWTDISQAFIEELVAAAAALAAQRTHLSEEEMHHRFIESVSSGYSPEQQYDLIKFELDVPDAAKPAFEKALGAARKALENIP